MRFLSVGGLLVLLAAPGHAAELFPSDGSPGDLFGRSVSLWGPLGVVGAYLHDTGISSHPITERGQGMVYFYQELDRAAGRVREMSKLLASDGQTGDGFGYSAVMHGTSCLVGAAGAHPSGAAYLFRDLDEAEPRVTETAKLLPPAPTGSSGFGFSVGLWKETGLVGAPTQEVEGRRWQGAAYLFHHLDTAEGEITESVMLLASDGMEEDKFGETVVLGEIGVLVSAPGRRSTDEEERPRAVYLFRDLETATAGVITETAQLVPSDSPQYRQVLGSGMSLWGSRALINFGPDIGTPTNTLAYLFRDLDLATGVVTETARLTIAEPILRLPTNGVGLSGDAAVVADHLNQAAYLYVDLGTAEGEVREVVRLTPSHRGTNFGGGHGAVSLDGDVFLIGDSEQSVNNSLVGAAYCGRVSTFTTVDEGEAEREISFLSFDSRVDWVIGAATSGNRLTLGVGDEATVTAVGKAVYLGRDAGANDNALALAGRLTANQFFIGAVVGNRGNTLHLADTGAVFDATLRLAPGNFLTLEGNQADPDALSERLGTAKLHAWNGAAWQAVDIYNHAELVKASYDIGTNLTTVASVQEPITIPVPTLTLTVTEAPGQLQLRVSGAPDSAWVLQRSDDLTEWEDLQVLTLDAAGFATITGLPASLGAVFYRCVLVP